MRDFDWRAWLERLVRLWRSSLQVRTVAITVVLSGLAVAIIGGYMSISIGNNLFESKRNTVEANSSQSATTAQAIYDSASEDGAGADFGSATQTVLNTIARSSTGTDWAAVAIFRPPGQEGPRLITDQATGRLDASTVDSLITPEMDAALEASGGRQPYLQSVGLDVGNGIEPGIIVGTRLQITGAGDYNLYLVYDLQDAQDTLNFVQQTLLIGGLALVLLIGAVTYIVVRLVVAPVRLAAETSEKLAAGHLEVRIPERGEDVIATLARSFNGMAASMQSQITKLAALSQVQQRFVSDVSHELRTPLTTIRLAGDVLYDQRGSFPPATARTAELLHTQVQRFELLLADLLEMSRYDAGAVDMETEPTNLVRLVEDAIESVATLATSKGSDLRLLAPGGYFEADVDSRRIRRILYNLLGNAIDHGEGKPIVVYVDSSESAVAIAVRDYGVGMTPAAMERVFDRFWRADPSRQRSTGGTGLGLAISLEDAALHGGWLEVWSAEGRGSCFRVTLPRQRGVVLTASPLELPPDDAVPDLEVARA